MNFLRAFLLVIFTCLLPVVGRGIPLSPGLGGRGNQDKKVSVTTQSSPQGIVDTDNGAGLTFAQDKPRLNQFALNLKRDFHKKLHVIVYGGRIGPRGEAKIRADCIRNYLVRKHGISPKQVIIVDGGYRDEVTVELSLLSPEQTEPSPVPTIAPSEVQIIKNINAKKGYRRSSQPSCK